VLRPVVGITTYALDDRGQFPLPAEYVAAVRRAGGLPLLIPPVADLAAAYLKSLDGLVLAGGGDISPACYGGTPHESLYGMDEERDRLEIALAREAVERRMPTLAICRGMQILNVALGGSLIEHLPDAVGVRVAHRAPPRRPVPHAVRVQAGSRLAAILGATDIEPMSWHHQGIRRLAPGLTPVAFAPDETIEGVELAGHAELVAVQWHPELTAHRDPVQQRLFDALVASASPPGRALAVP
jgi:putative glutamine amidotransferase